MECKATKQLKLYLDRIADCIKKKDFIFAAECQKEVKAFEKKFKAEHVGTGISRVVYAIDDCVVKFAIDSYSRKSNKTEYETYSNLPEEVKELFIPVTDHHEEFYWNMSPKAKVFQTREEYYKAEEIVKQIEKELKEKGYKCADLHEGNVGLLNDKPIIVNYGFGVTECPVPLKEKKSA